MSEATVPFEKRLRQIVRRHKKMSHGAVRSVNAQGLIVARPVLYKPVFPLRSLLATVALFVALKAVLMAGLGQAAYAERVDGLRSGSILERMGAFVMQAEPVSETAAKLLENVLPH